MEPTKYAKYTKGEAEGLRRGEEVTWGVFGRKRDWVATGWARRDGVGVRTLKRRERRAPIGRAIALKGQGLPRRGKSLWEWL